MNKKAELDAIAKRFLGTNNVNIITGQKSNEQKQKEMQEHYLLEEAKCFGDTLVRYIVAHRKLLTAQRAWSFGLTLFCLREDYPHGIDEFDELIDQGGKSLALDDQNFIVDGEKELPEFTDIEQRQAAELAEKISKYVETKKHQLGLSNSQAVYGMGRAFHNLRLGYPLEEGSTEAFDTLVKRANQYFVRFR